jgi:O-methyltransferase
MQDSAAVKLPRGDRATERKRETSMWKDVVEAGFAKFGYSVRRIRKAEAYPDMDPPFWEVMESCRNYTMTSVERVYAIYKSIEYLTRYEIDGDIAECGVWRGGSAMACALSLMHFGDQDRKIYLYDTYEGMSQASAKDVSFEGQTGDDVIAGRDGERLIVSLDAVQENLYSTGYPRENLVFVQGKVEDTIPGTAPDRLALLRLDTDWYESTKHELEHLFPRLVSNGILIIDDYGYWRGAREAVDEYFRTVESPVLLDRIDHTGRLAVKPAASARPAPD